MQTAGEKIKTMPKTMAKTMAKTTEKAKAKAPPSSSSAAAAADTDVDENLDICYVCGFGGNLTMCDSCIRAYHKACLSPQEQIAIKKEATWVCPQCRICRETFSLNDLDLKDGSLFNLVGPCAAVCSGNVTLGALILTLEWKMDDFLGLAGDVPRIMSSYFSEHTGTCVSDPRRSSLQYHQLLWTLRKAVGATLFDETYESIAAGKDSLARGLAPSPAFMSKGCSGCGRTRYFYTFCHYCAHVHDVKQELRSYLAEVPGRIFGFLMPFEKTKIRVKAKNGGSPSPAVEERSSDYGSPVKTETNVPETQNSEERRLQCAYLGAKYLHACAMKTGRHGDDDDSPFTTNGGDMMFLMRNLVACVSDEHRGVLRGYLQDMLMKWTLMNERLPIVFEENFTNCMEGFQVICQLLRKDSLMHSMYTKPDVVKIEQQPEISCEADQSDDRIIGQKSKLNSIDGSGSEDRSQRRHCTRSRSCSSGRDEVDNLDNDAYEVPVGVKLAHLDISAFKKVAKRSLNTMHVSDLVGYNPKIREIPLTPMNHCPHCSHEIPKKDKRSKCVKCKHNLKMKVDYGALTDALVWAYVFHDCGVEINCNDGVTSLSDVVSMLSLTRCYQRIDELGHNFYRLQCYYLTHLIYVFSDWGQHALRRQLFPDEFEFIVLNIITAIRIDDPEVVSEFIQCLKILQVTRESDPDVWVLIELGYRYLIGKETDKGKGKGLWVGPNDSLYNRYHASYCAAIALFDYDFLQNETSRLRPPRPRLIEFLS